MQKNQQSGRTLLESILVISFIGVLSVGILKVVNTMITRYKQSRVTQQIREVQKSITDHYAVEGVYTALSTEDFIRNRLAVGDINVSADQTRMEHAMGGGIIVGPSGANDETFVVTFFGLNLQSCLDMSTIDWVMNDSTELRSIAVFNSSAREVPEDSEILTWTDDEGGDTLPVTLQMAMGLCMNNSDNVISWEFY